MKPITKATPLTMVGLLSGGGVLFGLNAFLPLPIETWFAIAGMLFFAAGLIVGVAALVRGIASLSDAESRRATGVLLPILTILIAVGVWTAVVTTAITARRSLEQREESQHNPGP